MDNFLKVDIDQPIPKPVYRIRNDGSYDTYRYPFMFMAEGRSFTVPLNGRRPESATQTFWSRYERAVKSGVIGPGCKFKQRKIGDNMTFWCVKWVPGMRPEPLNPPEELRGKGWDDPAEAEPSDELI